MLAIVLWVIEFLISIYKSETEAKSREVGMLKDRYRDFQAQESVLNEKNNILQQRINSVHSDIKLKESQLEKMELEAKSIDDKIEQFKKETKTDEEAVRENV